MIEPKASPQLSDALAVRLRKRFGPRGFAVDVQFMAPSGITILLGPSGAGKTTVLDCIAGLLKPDAGIVSVGSRTLFDSEKDIDVPVAKRGIGYVFQDLALFPHMTVAQNVQYGLSHVSADACRARAFRLMESFRIAHLDGRKPAEISGGERQRTALARALVTDPSLLLLDEPLAALDVRTKSRIIDDLRVWNDAHRIPVLYVTHSRDEVFALGERVIALEDGGVLAVGTPQEVLVAPRQETIAQLAGFENIFDATIIALHEQQGTMTCRLARSAQTGQLGSEPSAALSSAEPAGSAELEVPLGRMQLGDSVRVGIRAGDILVANLPPRGLSARNVLAGTITRLEQRDVTVIANVDCGVPIEAHLTPAARDSLGLAPGLQVWLVIKTYSCHLLR